MNRMRDVTESDGRGAAPQPAGREAGGARSGDRRPAARRRLALRRLRRIRGGVALYVAVAAGAVIGGVLRALASHFIPDTAAGFVGGTLLVNVLGSFLIGLYAGLTGPDGRLFVGPGQRAFVMIGFCGGFTTFSVFSLETFRLATDGAPGLAAANAGVSVVTWLGAVWAGQALASRFNRMGGL